MDTSKLKKFAQAARQELLEQVGSKLAFVLKPESPARREYPAVVNELEKAMSAHGKAALIDQVAYTWFNRFCALRFMDVNGYNRVGVVSPAEGQVQPEILAEAKSGVIDDDQINAQTIEKIRGLLNGSIPSPDAQSEAYRLLIVGSCNALYDRMPYLFERIQDFTELLMPDDLLSDNSILTKMREVMTPKSCTDVEIIGWLYQFYISEKKDEVFAGLKKNQKITAENIPAATQLFTPHWIVRYLVENSLGRLWMLNRPNSTLTEQMEYYIAPEEPETDFLQINSPEEIKIADPAAGSGHMLTYAFDLLYAIYEEEGYDPNDIPGLILSNNLYGIEIDERAGALASFALEMKAAAKLGRRRFFRMDAKPNVCVLEDVSFTDSEMNDVMSIVGKDLYSADLRETLTQFEQAKNFGSLIVPKLKDPAETLRLIETKDLAGDMWLAEVHGRLVKVLRMAEDLSPKYHVVVANPPYLGGKGMNGNLSIWAKKNYPKSKTDMYSMFIERSLNLVRKNGLASLITIQNWMFLSSFELLRVAILNNHGIRSFMQIGYNSFPELNSKVAQAAAFIIQAEGSSIKAEYFNLNDAAQAADKEKVFKVKRSEGNAFKVKQRELIDIPGYPIAYWVNANIRAIFSTASRLGDLAKPRQGLASGDNDRFMRYWHEVGLQKTGFKQTDYKSAVESGFKWFPHNKGGAFRKWFGNNEYVLAFDDENFKALSEMGNHLPSRQLYFKEGMTWTALTSGKFNGRYTTCSIFDAKGPVLFANKGYQINIFMSFCNSIVANEILKILAPTLDFNQGPVGNLPIIEGLASELVGNISQNSDVCVKETKKDWDSNETSWDFKSHPLLRSCEKPTNLIENYNQLISTWQSMTEELLRCEETNNRIFIEVYGLQDELSPEVPIEEITLTCNPAYRYGIKGTEEEREARLKADTIAEFLSYAVGCMFGRYSLDEPGLILANQGETLADYLARIPGPTFMPDDDNVIPLIDFEGDWFEDDISERFKQFLRVTFGDEHYAENLTFIEDALGKSIQKYFVKDFYNDHVQRYKKRPIYWLFSSPKGTFNALIYMHRYTPSTASVVLNEYLREFRTKLEARRDSNEQISISASSSQKEKTAALKMIDKLNKAIEEVNDYEREVLYPLAGQNIAIDLDDGVKHNYPLFGTALKKITGLS